MVITNYRHAFGYAGGVQQMKDNPKFRQLTSGNEGQYIFEAFPAVTATVVQNAPLNFSKTFFFPLFQPINKGIWDKAFLSTANTPVGFDSKNSPFGADYFDMYPTNGSSLKLKYQDFFTGIIFNKPYFDLKMIDYPYKRYATEFEYRNNKGKFQYDEYVRALDFYTNDKVSDDNFDGMSYAIGFINFVGILFFIMINFVAFCIATYHLLKILI